MDSFKSSQFLVSLLIGALCLHSFSLLWVNRDLSKQNQHLLDNARNIQRSLEIVQSKYQALLRETEEIRKNKKTSRDTIESLKKQNESLDFQAKKMESRLNAVKEEKNYLEEMLINRTKEIDILKSRREESVPGVTSSAIEEKEGELKKLNEQNQILQQKLDRLFRTTHEKINEINVAKIALADTVSTAQRRIEDEWNTVNLGSITTSAMPSYQNQIEEVPTQRATKTEGHVLAINSEHGFVVIDIGKVDNLSSEATLEVKKNGVAIATLSVLEIRDAMAACNIRDVQDGQRIEINDPVSILR